MSRAGQIIDALCKAVVAARVYETYRKYVQHRRSCANASGSIELEMVSETKDAQLVIDGICAFSDSSSHSRWEIASCLSRHPDSANLGKKGQRGRKMSPACRLWSVMVRSSRLLNRSESGMGLAASFAFANACTSRRRHRWRQSCRLRRITSFMPVWIWRYNGAPLERTTKFRVRMLSALSSRSCARSEGYI